MMAEGNGDSNPDAVHCQQLNDGENFSEYDRLIAMGIDENVALKIDELFISGKLLNSDLDERTLDAFKECSVDHVLVALNQLNEMDAINVSDKSAYLCGLLKSYCSGDVKESCSYEDVALSTAPTRGPDEVKLRAMLDRTGYSLDITTGQRKYGGPPPNWDGKPPGPGCEVFCGRVPKDIFEDELVPIFEQCGEIWDLRIMVDPQTSLNRGYAFVTYTDQEGAKRAVKDIDGYEIRESRTLKVNISVPNLRLFIGNIPKCKSKEDIIEEFGRLTDGLTDVIIYSSPDDNKKNRGFCFLQYESHKVASLAKRRLSSGRVRAWSCEIIVDWADPQEEPDSETMSKVKVLYTRNLTHDCTEDRLLAVFQTYGVIERVKKIKDYAFIHFQERDNALRAMENLNGIELCGSTIDVSLAKPPSDKKKKEEMLRNRERRMLNMMAQRGMEYVFPTLPTGVYSHLYMAPVRNVNAPQMPPSAAAGYNQIRPSQMNVAQLRSYALARGDYDKYLPWNDYYPVYPNNTCPQWYC